MAVTGFWIFENILAIIPPPKRRDSRAPLGLQRPCGAAKSHLHSSSTTRQRSAVGAPPQREGSVEIALPGTARLAPGVEGNSKQLQISSSPRVL